MTTLSDIAAYLFGGPITQGFGVPESWDAQGNVTHTEQGIDVGLPTGSTVTLVENSTYLGTDRGYRDLFLGASGYVEQYQHIVSNPFTVGQQYARGTQVGTVASADNTPSGYYTTGPHLEFALYANQATANTFSGALDPTTFLTEIYNNIVPSNSNPTPVPSNNPTPTPSNGTPTPGPPTGDIPNPVGSVIDAAHTLWGYLTNGTSTIDSVPGLGAQKVQDAANFLGGKTLKIGLVLLFVVIGLILLMQIFKGGSGESGSGSTTVIA